MVKVLCAAPCGKNPVCDGFYDCFYDLVLPEGSQRLRAKGGSLPSNRNEIIKKAQEGGFTHVFLIDDDNMVAHDFVSRLLAHDKDVVAGHCLQRLPPFRSYVFGGMNEEGKLGFQNLTVETGLVKVTGVGTSGILIKTSVFDKLTKPYFYHTFRSETEWGDDINFNKSLTENNIEIYCDLDATIWHATNASVAPIFEDGQWKFQIKIGDAIAKFPVHAD